MAKRQVNSHSPSMVKFFFTGVVVFGIVAGFTYYFLTNILKNSKASPSAIENASRCFRNYCRVSTTICPSKLTNGKYGLLPTANQFCQQCHSMCYEAAINQGNRPDTNPFVPPPRD